MVAEIFWMFACRLHKVHSRQPFFSQQRKHDLPGDITQTLEITSTPQWTGHLQSASYSPLVRFLSRCMSACVVDLCNSSGATVKASSSPPVLPLSPTPCMEQDYYS